MENDLISRQAAIELIERMKPYHQEADDIAEMIANMPSAQPESHYDEWCTDCKEYDHERHCCLRWNRFIRQTVEDLKGAKRKTGKWIERNPQNSDKCRLIECDQCGFSHIVGFNVPYEHWIENRNFCERCGADMRGEDGK